MILGVFPELLTPGGIQRIGQHTAAVLTSLARSRDLACHLISLNDPPGCHTLEVGDVAFPIQGFGRQKGRLVLSVLKAAHRTRLAYFGHPNLAPLGLILRCVRPSVRYYVTTYGIDVWEPLPLSSRLGLRWAHAVMALSQYTREKMVVAQRLRPEKAAVLPPALDPAFLRAGVSLALSRPPLPEGNVLLTVARLAASERYKGIETVFQALPGVLTILPNTYYVIVGDGDDRGRLEHLATDVGVSDHVLFVGAKIGDELASYYAASDVFVMPSRGEGFGVVFLEAMALGKPVIGGNHGGTPDVVIDGVTGFLVEYGDVDAIADRLIRLLRDKELRMDMGEAGRRRVHENYSLEHFHRGLVALLTERTPCKS